MHDSYVQDLYILLCVVWEFPPPPSPDSPPEPPERPGTPEPLLYHDMHITLDKGVCKTPPDGSISGDQEIPTSSSSSSSV